MVVLSKMLWITSIEVKSLSIEPIMQRVIDIVRTSWIDEDRLLIEKTISTERIVDRWIPGIIGIILKDLGMDMVVGLEQILIPCSPWISKIKMVTVQTIDIKEAQVSHL